MFEHLIRLECRMLSYETGIESNFQTFAICLFFIAQLELYKLNMDIYHFLQGNVSRSYPI